MMKHIKRLAIGTVVLAIGLTAVAWIISNIMVALYATVGITVLMTVYLFGLIIDDEVLS